MKKTLLLLLASAFMLTGCGETGPQGPKGDKGDQGIQGPKGDSGVDGASFLNGTVNPVNTLGKDGDCYLNTSTNDVFSKSNGEWSLIGNLKGDEGKSAYETYIEYHPEYKKSEEEWIDEFCKKDETDYSLYDDFEFVPITYGGLKGYSASYIGKGGDIAVPETFNLEPVLGFKFGFNDMHELFKEDPEYRINSIHFPTSVKFIALNGNSNYALSCLVETTFIFTASIDEVLYSNYMFEEIYFDGSEEELLTTNLEEKFPRSNISAKDGEGQYHKVIDNFDKFAEKYSKIREQIELLKEEYVPDMMTKFDDGFIDVPTKVTYQFQGADLEASVKVVVNDETSACSAYQNRLTYVSSNVDNFKGKEVFLVDFVFELEGEKHVGSSSTVIISKKPNIFKTFDISFDLVEYNEFDSRFIGNLYSNRLSVKFKEGSKQIKAYIENGFGIFETAMPILEDDPVGFVSPYIEYDAENQCFNCTKAGDYSLGFGYVAGDKEFVFHANELDTFGTKISQTIIEFLQNNFVSHGGTVYVNVDDTVMFPESLDVVVDGKLITFSVTLEASPQYFFIDGTKVTFLLENDDPAFSSLTFRASNTEERLYSSFYIGFNIFK